MQTRTLETLLEISELGSFALAAQSLNMTLSAVSMQMKVLEQELGVPLFDRTFRPPQLTPAGRSVCGHAAQIVSAEKALRQDCAATEDPMGLVRMGFVMTASVRLLPDFLLKARVTLPKVTWEITGGLSEALESDVLAGRLDGAVVTASPQRKAGLRYTPLREEPLCYAVPASAKHLPTQDLAGALPFLQFAPASGVGKLIAQHAATYRYPKARSIVLDNIESIMQCVNAGVGFSLLPRPDLERYATETVSVRDMAAGEAVSRQIVLAKRDRDGLGLPLRTLAGLFGGGAGL